MDFLKTDLDTPLLNTLHHLLDSTDNSTPQNPTSGTHSYMRDARAMAQTPVDIIDNPDLYRFVIDMPRLKSEDIKVQVEDENVLVISGEREREEEKEGLKYLRMERRVGKFMRKFVLPENANVDGISGVCENGVLCVTVDKFPPPKPKKPRTIQVNVD